MTEGRAVRVLVSRGEEWLGALPEFDVKSPWWADVQPVTAEVERRLGVPTAVLRVLDTTTPAPRDGTVTYHAEVYADPGPQPWSPIGSAIGAAVRVLETNRLPWAEPGGPAAARAWADGELDRLGRPRSGPVEQIKTWNLSAVDRIPTTQGDTWLKSTAPFLEPESTAIAVVARRHPDLTPDVLAADPTHRRLLSADLPGADCWDADDQTISLTLTRWVHAQADVHADLDAGDPDTCALPREPLAEVADRLAAHVDRDDVYDLDDDDRNALREMITRLPARIRALEDAGLPETLVHGDFHPGNWRRGVLHGPARDRIMIMDWGEVRIAHPALDLRSLRSSLDHGRWTRAVRTWANAWRDHLPGTQPERAVDLIAPLALIEAGLLYQRFLDHIEPDERRYHDGDPGAALRDALRECTRIDQ